MTSKNDGGYAFPCAEGKHSAATLGMTLRDWFAGQALAGLLASPRGPVYGSVVTDTGAAHTAYAVADAMLKERSK